MSDFSREVRKRGDGRLKRVAKDELAAIRKLYDLSIRTVDEGDLAAIMDDILETAIYLAGADMGGLHLYDERTGVLKNAASRGFGPAMRAAFRTLNVGQGACGTALARRERVIVEDVGHSCLFAGMAVRDALLAAGVRSLQSTPLVARTGRLVGVVSTHYRERKRAAELNLRLVDLLAGQAADIIAQVEDQRALRETNRRVADILESITDAFYAVNADWRLTYVNRKAEEWWRRRSEAVIGTVLWDMFPGYEAKRDYHEHVRAMRERRHVQYEVESADGCWLEVSIYPAPDGGLSVYFRDVTERKQAQEVLMRQAEDRFEKIFRSSPVMVVIIRNDDDRYVEVNERFLDAIEYSRDEVVGRTPMELGLWAADAQTGERLRAALLQRGEYHNAEFRLTTKTGKLLITLASAVLIDFNGEHCRLATLQDVTREKQMEAELVRLERLNLVGEMAASIGHEVRNPLTTVRGYLQMLERKAENARYGEQFKTMIEELDRANSIISEFLSLAKNRSIKLDRANLNEVIDALLPLLHAEGLRTGHEIRVALGDVPDIALDDKEVRQLILNLAKNGLEAMAPGGRLTLASFREGGKAVLEVGDTGPGIPPAVLDKLGTPFVTTKENGTGLGLAVCYRIAERHGAQMAVSTSPRGTVFTVSFAI